MFHVKVASNGLDFQRKADCSVTTANLIGSSPSSILEIFPGIDSNNLCVNLAEFKKFPALK